MGTLVP